MDTYNLQFIKIEARKLQEKLKKELGKASYQICLQTLAKQYGFKNWQTASAYAKENNIKIFDAPITNKGAFQNV